jgi:aminoglycoside phosphotransferase family enzyme/predicted kinase
VTAPVTIAGDALPLGADRLVRALLDPKVYGVEVPVEMRETHISWVFLAGQRAYKLKKPVRFPFLDYSTPARRAQLCREEVRLNRRLAPGIYLDVRAVVPTRHGVRLADADDPEAVDHLVEMRRFDERRTLAGAVAAGSALRLDELAVALVRFHRAAPVRRRRDPVGAWRAIVAENLATLRSLAPAEDTAMDRYERFAMAFLSGHVDRLESRMRAGRVRGGHGDLRADHVILEHPLAVVDCLEFDPELRVADVGADIATLVADLTARGAPAAAAELVAHYRDAGGDPGDDALLSFWAAHRALVAAKVTVLRAERGDRAERLIALADHFCWRARLPVVLAVSGVAASGKSTLAAELARRSGLTVVSSDRVRKELAGVPATVRAPATAYQDAMTRRSYAELGRRARAALEEDGGVIVDATFHRRDARRRFEHALGGAVPPVYLYCQAPPDVLRRRAEARLSEPHRESDAGPEVCERQLAAFEPFGPEAAAFAVLSEGTPAAVVERALDALDLHLAASDKDPLPVAASPGGHDARHLRSRA